MRFMFGFVLIGALSTACLADNAANNEIKRLNSISPIIRQLEIVSVNLNQLQSVLNEMGNEFTKMTSTGAHKRESTKGKIKVGIFACLNVFQCDRLTVRLYLNVINSQSTTKPPCQTVCRYDGQHDARSRQCPSSGHSAD